MKIARNKKIKGVLKKPEKNKDSLVGWLIGFYGISTLVGLFNTSEHFLQAIIWFQVINHL